MKRKTLFRYVLLPALILLGATAFYIYKEYNRTHKDTAELKTDYSITASEFIQEFLTDEQAANKKYWDKVIAVKGLVKNIEKDGNGFYSIILGDTLTSSSVRCTLDSIHNKEAELVKKGEETMMKGICAGFNADELLGSDVILVRSVVEIKN